MSMDISKQSEALRKLLILAGIDYEEDFKDNDLVGKLKEIF